MLITMVLLADMNFISICSAYVIIYNTYTLHAFIIVDLSSESLEHCGIFIYSNVKADENL